MPDIQPFKLHKGDVTDFEGDAIVIPCWTTLHTGNAVSIALNEKLQNLGVDPKEFWPELVREEVPLFSAYYFERPLPKTKSIILATCYTGHDIITFRERALRTTRNVLDVAKHRDVRSIGFPAYMTGDQGGKIEEVVPAMGEEFYRHIRTGATPNEITLYAFGNTAYRTARDVLKRMLPELLA